MLQDFCSKITFIVQAVSENEYQAAVTLMKPPAHTPFTKAVVFPRPGTVIGMFADKKTALIYTGEGSDCSDYVQDAIDTFPNAHFIIGIGVGYAFDNEQHKLGDVLVSKQICDLKNLRFNRNNELTDRGQRVNVVKDLASVLCMDLTHEEQFEVSDTKRCSNVVAGQFVSIPAIVESKDIREKIHRSVPEAIGGDMEGGELLKFRMKGKIEGMVVVKGVSHYADGHRAEEWEFTASLAALHYANSKLHYYQGQLFVCLFGNILSVRQWDIEVLMFSAVRRLVCYIMCHSHFPSLLRRPLPL